MTSQKAKANSHKKVVKKVVVKKIKKTELDAFSKGQNAFDMMEDQEVMSSQRMLKMMMDGKKEAKKEVLGKMGGATDTKTPLLIMFASDLSGEKTLFPEQSLYKLLEGLLVLNLKIIIVSGNQRSDLNNLSELPEHAENRIIWYNPKQDNSGHGREEKEIDRLLLACDMALVFDRQHDLLKLLMKYGVVIIGEEASPFLENYHPNTESGNAFTYTRRDLWSIFATLVRALETYKFPYDWQNIVRKILK